MDAFAYCQRVQNRDVGVQLRPPLADEQLTTSLHAALARMPYFRERARPGGTLITQGFTWRCWSGDVYVCYVGASGSACTRKVPDTAFLPIVSRYCAQYPGSTVPMAVQADSASSWSCAGTAPRADSSYPVDQRGYLIGAWQHLAPILSDAAIEAQCRKYFKSRLCSEALGRWLPGLHRTAPDPPMTPTRMFDGFSKMPNTYEAAGYSDAPVGTEFVHGEAGPPRGSAVYDPAHRIAFYGEGCCSYFRVVLASHVLPPPVRLVSRDLTDARLNSGLKLGDSVAEVSAVYGAAPIQRVAARPQMRFLFYQNAAPPKPGPCVQWQAFGFIAGRLAYIAIYNGC